MRISDWSSDVCSSVRRGLMPIRRAASRLPATARTARPYQLRDSHHHSTPMSSTLTRKNMGSLRMLYKGPTTIASCSQADDVDLMSADQRSEEHPSEFQSLMRISYAVFCL